MIKGSNMAIFVSYAQTIVKMYQKTAKNTILVTFDLHSDLEITPFAGQGSPLIWYSRCTMIKGFDMAIFACYTSSVVEMYPKTIEKCLFGDL